MNSLTLHFEDEVIEQQLRSDTVYAANSVILMFLVLNSVLNYLAGLNAHLVGNLSLICTYSLGLVVLFHRRITDQNLHRVHTLAASLWAAAWVINCSVWWMLISQGSLERLKPHEGRKAASACALWVLATVTQHVVHIPATNRFLILSIGMTIVLSSPVWRGELTTSMVIGEFSGYALERMLRNSWLRQFHQLDHLRCARERATFDIALLAKDVSDAWSAASAASRSSRRSGGSARSGPRSRRADSASSSAGCSSEIDDLALGASVDLGSGSLRALGSGPRSDGDSSWSVGSQSVGSELDDEPTTSAERDQALMRTLLAAELILPPSPTARRRPRRRATSPTRSSGVSPRERPLNPVSTACARSSMVGR